MQGIGSTIPLKAVFYETKMALGDIAMLPSTPNAPKASPMSALIAGLLAANAAMVGAATSSFLSTNQLVLLVGGVTVLLVWSSRAVERWKPWWDGDLLLVPNIPLFFWLFFNATLGARAAAILLVVGAVGMPIVALLLRLVQPNGKRSG